MLLGAIATWVPSAGRFGEMLVVEPVDVDGEGDEITDGTSGKGSRLCSISPEMGWILPSVRAKLLDALCRRAEKDGCDCRNDKPGKHLSAVVQTTVED